MGVTFPNESTDYRAARDRLLQMEIEERRMMEAVAAARRALPPGGTVPEDYVFDGLGADGKPAKIELSGLFAPGKDALIIYDFMFPRHAGDERPKPVTGESAHLTREESPCPSCAALLDFLDRAAPHLEAAGFNFVVVAKAPLDRVIAFARDRGWRSLRLVSSAGNRYKRDYNAESDDGLAPMMTVFERSPDGIRHFWSSELYQAEPEPGQDTRHNGTLDLVWNLIDQTRPGRPNWEEQYDYPPNPDHRPAPIPSQ